MIAKALLYLGAALLLGSAAVRQLLWPLRLRWLGVGYTLLGLGAALSVGQTLAALGALTLPDLARYLLDIAAGRATLWLLLGATLLLASEVSRFSRLTSLGAAALAAWGLAGIGHGAVHGPFIRLLHALHAVCRQRPPGGVLYREAEDSGGWGRKACARLDRKSKAERRAASGDARWRPCPA